MASKQEIELIITPEGEIKVHVKGVKGPGCDKLIRDVAEGLGCVKALEPTPEYYEKPEAKQSGKLKN